MFAEHLAECRELGAQARAELAKACALPEQERCAAAAAVFGLLKQADDTLQSLQLAARHEAPADRAKLAKEEAGLRADLRQIAQDLESARKDYLLGPSSGNTDKLFLAREERKRSTAVTESLRRGDANLKRASTQAIETEEVGVQTLQRLREQREQILGAKDRTASLGQNLTEAQQSVQELERTQCSVM